MPKVFGLVPRRFTIPSRTSFVSKVTTTQAERFPRKSHKTVREEKWFEEFPLGWVHRGEHTSVEDIEESRESIGVIAGLLDGKLHLKKGIILRVYPYARANFCCALDDRIII